MPLDKQQVVQDASCLLEAMTLINKTLASTSASNRETFYDFCDSLDDAGNNRATDVIESVGTKFAALDPKLKAQFDLYRELKPTKSSIRQSESCKLSPERGQQFNDCDDGDDNKFSAHKQAISSHSIATTYSASPDVNVTRPDLEVSREVQPNKQQQQLANRQQAAAKMLARDQQQHNNSKLMTKNLPLAARQRNSTPSATSMIGTSGSSAPRLVPTTVPDNLNDTGDSYESATDEFGLDQSLATPASGSSYRRLSARESPSVTPSRVTVATASNRKTTTPINCSSSSSNSSTPTSNATQTRFSPSTASNRVQSSSSSTQVKRTCKPNIVVLNNSRSQRTSDTRQAVDGSSVVKTNSQKGSAASGSSETNTESNQTNETKEQLMARGKQQRASISSCSSSDSYASYGSGYASGSGNSTDHEQKQRHQRQQLLRVKPEEPPCDGVLSSASSTSASSHSPKNVNDDDDDDDDVDDDGDAGDRKQITAEEEEDAKRDSQLKRHLSELEQLTDQLASRNLLTYGNQIESTTIGTASDATNVVVAPVRSGCSSAASSKPSSVLSIDGGSSNLSSLTSDSCAAQTSCPKTHTNNQSEIPSVEQQMPTIRLTRQPSIVDSRSNSSTPTSVLLASKRPSISSTPLLEESNLPTYRANAGGDDLPRKSSPLVAESSSHLVSTPKPSISVSSKVNEAPKAVSALPLTTPVAAASASTTTTTTTIPVATTATITTATASSSKHEPYYHNLFHWEQLVSKGVTRPLLINDLDFTDLRDEDDCDLLNSSSANNRGRLGGNPGEPLTISIPPADSNADDLVDSGCGSGSPKHQVGGGSKQPVDPSGAPPPPMPPPISPWFNTIAGNGMSSRPQSQLLLNSPTPLGTYDPASKHPLRDQAASPVGSTYSTYSRNSVFLPQTSTPTRDHLDQYSATMQPVSSLRSASSMSSLLFGNGQGGNKYGQLNKRKKTMKLFWKEVREDRSLLAKLTKKKTIWDEIKPATVDTQKLEYLFESKAKDLLSLSRSRNGLDGMSQRKVKITVLDAKRSNAINIGMTKLPPIRTIKSAILKMDSSIMNREGIEKILTTMMPTEEEKSRIIEAQLANPETPLGTAEQFLLNLASISALEARLKLWAFQLDYAQIEKEVAEPLMDLKQAIEEIESSETFRIILGTLLSIGNFLNSTNVKGFQIDYLEKVPEVKDTVHKHSLLHHLCLFIHENYDPNLSRDLYSEFSAVNRASKIDYIEVGKNLKKMQQDCRASWDYLKIVAKHDGLANLINTSSASISSGSNSSGGASNNSSNSTSSVVKGSNVASASPTYNGNHQAGKLNNLSKLSMITTITGSESGQVGSPAKSQSDQLGGGQSSSTSTSSGSANNINNNQATGGKQLKMRVSDFLTDCAERIMVLMVIHRRVMNRFQKLLVYLGCQSQQIKQTQPQQILKIVNEFALEYRTKRERVREMLLKRQHQQQIQNQNQQQHHPQCQYYNQQNRWQLNRSRWAGSQQCISNNSANQMYPHNNSSATLQRPLSTASSYANGANQSFPQQQQKLQQQQQHRPGSPSGYSQISNYSDFFYDQQSSAMPSCCQSRQQSVTPLPGEPMCCNKPLSNSTGANPMSMSMLDLQQGRSSSLTGGNNNMKQHQDNLDSSNQSTSSGVQKDDQLRRLLGAGKSFDEACGDLFKMSHWTSVGGHHRPQRQPPKQRHGSVDASALSNQDNNSKLHDTCGSSIESSNRRQSSYYRHLNSSQSFEDEPNSDEEIMQCLVRTAVNPNGSRHNNSNNSTCSSSSNFRNRG